MKNTLVILRSEYAEGMQYRNAIGRASFTIRERDQALDEQHRVEPALSRGDVLVFLSPEGDNSSPHNQTPFWIGDVDVDEVAAGETTIGCVRWRACFKHGVARSDVNGGAWKHICIGHMQGRGGVLRFHEYISRCQVRGNNRDGHGPFVSSASRENVVLYGAKLTPKSQALSAQTKRDLWKLRDTLSANGGIPTVWGDV